MRTLEDGAYGDVLIVHSQPEQERTLVDAIRGLGHRVLIARTARETLSVLDEDGPRVHIALVSPVIGRSRARDVMRLIVNRTPHVRCMPLSHHGAQALLGAIRHGSGEAWSLSRLHKVAETQEESLATA
jgi:DNA-binding NtrC family response regulator